MATHTWSGKLCTVCVKRSEHPETSLSTSKPVRASATFSRSVMSLDLIELPIIRAEAISGVNAHDARAWFLSLEKHPERYQFATHGGFTFTHGNFGQIGAKFQTQETFYKLKATLRFELTSVDTFRFQFRLRRLPIWGAFIIEERSANVVKLSLHVGASDKAGRVFFCSLGICSSNSFFIRLIK